MRIPKLALGALCAIALAAQPAKANIITYTLGAANPGISGYTGPYGTVQINLTSSTSATITFTALDSSGGQHFLFGDGGSVGLNVNGTFSVSGITAPTGPQQGANAPGPWTVTSGNEDGFGHFNLSLDNFDGFSSAVRTVSFTLTDLLGTWGSASDVLALNSQGLLAAAHIFVANADYSNTGATGYAADSVPDGSSTVALLGGALAGIGVIRRKLRC